MNDILEKAAQLATATRAARQRTGNRELGTTARAGGVRAVIETRRPGKNTFDITYLTEKMTIDEAIEWMNKQ